MLVGRTGQLNFVVIVALSFASCAVQAQAPAVGKAAAEALFDRGLMLMREHRFAEACEQLEQSQAIEAGIGTMLYLGECYERLGRTASAWAWFREAASVARADNRPDREQWGLTRAAALEPQLCRLTVVVSPQSREPGLVVQVNGVALPSGAWGIPVPVDPGESRVEARAPGRLDWSFTQGVWPGNTVTINVPPLLPVPAPVAAVEPPAPAPAPSPLVTPPLVAAAREPSDGGSWPLQRTLGLTLGAAGVVAIGVGGYFGLRAIDKDADADHLCGERRACSDAQGVRLAAEANDAASLANVFVIGGAALAVSGVILHLTAASASAPAVALSGDRHGVRVTVGGLF